MNNDEVLEEPKVEVITADVYAAQIKAETDISIATAKQYPRVVSHVVENIKNLATLDKETAEGCWYSLPRGGKTIEGPSIRLAEIVATCWGNLRIANRITGMDKTTITAQAVVHDLETNVAIQTEVKRKIVDRHGKRYNEDMITMTGNAGLSVAMRNAIFKVVPMAVFKNVIDEVRRVGMGDARSLADARHSALTFFAGKAIKKEQVMSLLNVNDIEDIGVEEVATLRGLITAINEGTTTLKEAFSEAVSEEEKPLEDGKTSFGNNKDKK